MRGIARYSITLLPESPALVSLNLLSTLGSYTSKSSGNFTSGSPINFKLPVPEMTSLIVTASFVFTLVLLMEEEMLNSPTPPEKSAGLSPGKGFTSTVSFGVINVFLTSM